MAASVDDNYSDFDDSDTDLLTETFNKAAEHVKSIVANLESQKLLEIYSFYKQATVGKCNTPRPSWYELQSKAKWDAWNNLGEMSKDTAKENYIRIISQLDSNFNTSDLKSESWAAVSCFARSENDLDQSEKTAFDFVKEGDLDHLKKISNQRVFIEKDENEMTLLHWASDRGNVSVLEYLLEQKLDVNSVDGDGQTPLHYAVSCEHLECVKMLLKFGAVVNIKDSDGLTPKDATTDTEILKLLM